MPRRFAIAAVALMLAQTLLAPAVPAQDPGEFAAAGLYLSAGRDPVRQAIQLETDVAIAVTGVVARVAVSQRFRNESPDWVEGVYVFPLPDAAGVDRLRLRIGERVIEGEIQEREQALETYQRARDAGQQASLIEQERPNLFTTSVANIPPQQEIAIEIEYLQTVNYDEGEFSLRFPMTLTPRFIPGPAAGSGSGLGGSRATPAVPDASRITPPVLDPAGPVRNLARISLTVDAGAPLVELASRTHLTVTRGSGNPYTLEPAAGPVPMDRDFIVHWRHRPGSEPRALAFTESVQGEDYALVMLLPPVTASMPAATPRELVFVIDTSGSMGGASIEQARAALHFGIDRLTGIDRFNIIEFNSTARALYAAPTAFSAATLDQAHRFVDGLRANGGTNIASALGVALAGAPAPGYLRQIVFITDGSVGNEAELFRLITERLGDSRLFTVGIGSAPNSHFMRKAAQFGRGTQLHIARADEVATAMGRLFDRLGQVALREIRVDWPFAVEAYPERIPDLYRGEPVIVAARLGSGIAGTIPVTLTGQSGSFSWSEDIAIVPGASAGVASIWARRKIESLQDRRLEGVAEASIRPQVVEVALTHRLLSPYTSLVAVDRTPELTRTAALRREALGNLAPAGSEAGARFAMLAATATDARLLQFVGVLLTGLVLGLLGIWRLTRRLPG